MTRSRLKALATVLANVLLNPVLKRVFWPLGKLLAGIAALALGVAGLPVWIPLFVLYILGEVGLEIKDEAKLIWQTRRQERRFPSLSERLRASDWRRDEKGFSVHLKRVGFGLLFTPCAFATAPVWFPCLVGLLLYEVGSDILKGAGRWLGLLPKEQW